MLGKGEKGVGLHKFQHCELLNFDELEIFRSMQFSMCDSLFHLEFLIETVNSIFWTIMTSGVALGKDE